jgi:hypothetical protein
VGTPAFAGGVDLLSLSSFAKRRKVLSMPGDDRRGPQGARPSGTSDAPDMAGTVH